MVVVVVPIGDNVEDCGILLDKNLKYNYYSTLYMRKHSPNKMSCVKPLSKYKNQR